MFLLMEMYELVSCNWIKKSSNQLLSVSSKTTTKTTKNNVLTERVGTLYIPYIDHIYLFCKISSTLFVRFFYLVKLRILEIQLYFTK